MTHDEARLRAMLSESGIAEDGSEQLLASLSTLERYAEDPAPAPSPELTAMLDRMRHDPTITSLRRRPGRLLVASAVALGTVAAGGIAAAANELPPGAQDLVADFSDRYLNVELPRSEDRTDSSPEAEPTGSDALAGRTTTPVGSPAQVPTFEDGAVSVVVDAEAWANLGRLSAKPPPEPTAPPPPPTGPTPSLTPPQPAATASPTTSPTVTPTPTSTPAPGPTAGTSDGEETVETVPKTATSSTPENAPTTSPSEPTPARPAENGGSDPSTSASSPTATPSGPGTVARQDGSEAGKSGSEGEPSGGSTTKGGSSGSGSTD